MDIENAVELMRQAFTLVLTLAGPLLLSSLAVGLVVSILQAATQVHEQTLTFIPKLLIIGVILLLLSGWMLRTMVDFTNNLFASILQFMY